MIAVVNIPFEAIAQNALPGLVGTISVQVYDPSDAAVILPATSEGITEPAPGTYRAELVVTQTGSFRIRWDTEASSAEEDLTVQDQPPIGYDADGYPNLGTILAGSAVTALTEMSEAEQATLRIAAIAAVEDLCSQRLAPVDGSRRVAGTGGDELLLPMRLAVLDSVGYVGGAPFAPAEAVLTEDHSRLAFSSEWGGGWLPQAEWEAVGFGSPRRTWPLGVDNIAVAGTWGFSHAEAHTWGAITAALRIDMEDMALADQSELGDSLRAFRALGIRSLSQGNLAVSWGDGGGGAGAAATLPDRSVALLQGAGCVWMPFGQKAWGGPTTTAWR